MKSYIIPRDVKGETRILTFFTPKSFGYTLIGIIIGTFVFITLKALTLTVTGVIMLLIISLIAFVIGAAKIPETNLLPFFKDTGGEAVDDILWRYITFGKKKKIYFYGRRETK